MKTSVCLAAVITLLIIQMVNAQEMTRPPRKFICPKCDIVCLTEYIESKLASIIGCPPCRCPPTCRNFNCSYGEKCVMEQVPCKKTPCSSQPTCVSVNDMTTTKTPATTATRFCAEVMCMVGCERVLGSDGCPFCHCQTNCTAVTCPIGFECQMSVPCVKTACTGPRAICVPIQTTAATTPCPVHKCADGCDNSTTGPDGCPICICPRTCKDVNCTKDEECVLRELFCRIWWDHCFPVPTCVPRTETTAAPTPCPVYKCAEGCVPSTGTDGCPTCICNRTCKDVNCTKDEECVLRRQPFCPKWDPCFLIPTCVPRSETTTPTILESSTKKCEQNIACRDECRLLMDSDGCQNCDCPLTCETVDCPYGSTCEMSSVSCSSPSICFKSPICVPIIETTTPTIPESSTKKCERNINCSEECGLLMDSDGCPYCDCPLTCETVECRYGNTCEMRTVSCPRPSFCVERPLCVPIIETTTTSCPTVICESNCVEGRGSNGCPTCICNRTCRDVNCTEDEECDMKQNDCQTPPCLHTPTCVPRPQTCPMKSPCYLPCSSEFKKDENGCILCECEE